MRRWIYLDTIQLLHKILSQKTIASKTSFIQTLRATYLAKDKFSEDEAEILADLLTEIKQQSAKKQKATQALGMIDERIKTSIIQGSQQAVDSRTDKILDEGAAEKWASKQSGL